MVQLTEEEKRESNWEQMIVEHCPLKNCKGMLLNNIYSHYSKCSDCGKFFIQISELKEVSINKKRIKNGRNKLW